MTTEEYNNLLNELESLRQEVNQKTGFNAKDFKVNEKQYFKELMSLTYTTSTPTGSPRTNEMRVYTDTNPGNTYLYVYANSKWKRTQLT